MNSTTSEKLQALEDHAEAWRDIFEELHDKKLAQFANEPLDKKTAIVCTAFLVDAIKQACGILIRAEKTFHQEDEQRLEEQGLGEGYRDQLEPDGPLQYADGVRPWVAEILTEACGGIDGDLIEAYCNAFNFMHADDLCRATKNEKVLDREFSRIGEHPLPNKA